MKRIKGITEAGENNTPVTNEGMGTLILRGTVSSYLSQSILFHRFCYTFFAVSREMRYHFTQYSLPLAVRSKKPYSIKYRRKVT